MSPIFQSQSPQSRSIITLTNNPTDIKIIPCDSTHSQLSNEYMQYPTSQNFIFRYFSPNESKPRTYKSPCKPTINCPMPPPGPRWPTSTSPMRRDGSTLFEHAGVHFEGRCHSFLVCSPSKPYTGIPVW